MILKSALAKHINIIMVQYKVNHGQKWRFNLFSTPSLNFNKRPPREDITHIPLNIEQGPCQEDISSPLNAISLFQINGISSTSISSTSVRRAMVEEASNHFLLCSLVQGLDLDRGRGVGLDGSIKKYSSSSLNFSTTRWVLEGEFNNGEVEPSKS